MNEVATQRMTPIPTGFKAIIAGFAAGPVWRTAFAAGAALFVVGGAGLGAAAATGNEPVRELLRISSNSVIGVEFQGVVVDVQPGALRIDANGDLRIVTVDANTEITDSSDDVPFETIQPSMTAEIHGRLLSDNTILATRVNIEDDAGVPTFDPTLTPEPTIPAPSATAPVGVPTADDDDEDDEEDNRGVGNGDDDGDNDDNSGPGNADDNNDDNSGPGSGDDDGANNDDDDRSGSNSGSGGGDEGGDEDSGGSGSGGDDD